MTDIRDDVSRAIVLRIESPEFNSYNLPNEYSRFDKLVNVEITIPILTPPGYSDGHCKTVIDKCISKLNGLGSGYSGSENGFGGWEDPNTGESPTEPHIKLDVDFSIERWSFGADELRSIILMIQNELLQKCVKLTFNGIPLSEPFNLLGEKVNSFPSFEEFGEPDSSFIEEEAIDAYLVSSRSEFIDALKELVTNVPEIEPKDVSQNLADICDYIDGKKTSEIMLVTGRSGCGKSTQLSLIWNNSNKDLELFLTSGRNISDAYNNSRRWNRLINQINIGRPIIVEDVCVNTHPSKYQNHIDAIFELQQNVNSPIIVVTQTNKQLGKLFRINDIQLEGEISLDLSEENPDSIIRLLSKFHNVTIDIEGAKLLEDALASKRFTAREISQNLHMHSGEIVSKELISNWENSLKLIENLLVGVDSEDVAKILGLHKAINQPNALVRREIPQSYVLKLLGSTSTDLIEIGLVEDLRAKKSGFKLLKTTAEIWLDVALGNLSDLRDSKHFVTIREQFPLNQISTYYRDFLTKIEDYRKKIWDGKEDYPLPEEIADSWSQVGYDSFVFTPDHPEKNKLNKKEWQKIGEYLHSFLLQENGERNPWVDAKIVHDYSYRGVMAATYAEDVQRCYSLMSLHTHSLRDLGKTEELEWIRKAQMDTLQTPITKLNYAAVLWEQGQLDEAKDICISIINSNNLDNDIEKMCRNQLGLIYRDLDERQKAKQEFEKGLSIASKNENSNFQLRLNLLNLKLHRAKELSPLIDEYLEFRDTIDIIQEPLGYAIVCNKLGQIHLAEYEKKFMAYLFTKSMGFDYGWEISLAHREKALEYLLEAKQIRTELSDLQGLAGTNGFLAKLYEIEGELDLAFDMYSENYEWYREKNELNGQIVELMRMAEIKIQQGDLVHSTDLTTKAFELANEYGSPRYIQQVKNLIGKVIQLSK